jgi:hypothetical protein
MTARRRPQGVSSGPPVAPRSRARPSTRSKHPPDPRRRVWSDPARRQSGQASRGRGMDRADGRRARRRQRRGARLPLRAGASSSCGATGEDASELEGTSRRFLPDGRRASLEAGRSAGQGLPAASAGHDASSVNPERLQVLPHTASAVGCSPGDRRCAGAGGPREARLQGTSLRRARPWRFCPTSRGREVTPPGRRSSSSRRWHPRTASARSRARVRLYACGAAAAGLARPRQRFPPPDRAVASGRPRVRGRCGLSTIMIAEFRGQAADRGASDEVEGRAGDLLRGPADALEFGARRDRRAAAHIKPQATRSRSRTAPRNGIRASCGSRGERHRGPAMVQSANALGAHGDDVDAVSTLGRWDQRCSRSGTI